MTRPTIEQLDGEPWDLGGEPPSDERREVARLRRLPIDELTPADLRFLIVRRVALPTLVPMALGLIRVAPLYDAGEGPGDLLEALESLGRAYWAGRPQDAGVVRVARWRAGGRPAA